MILTERQAEVLDFCCDHLLQRQQLPTCREIGEAFDIRSPNGVMCHLKALVSKGYLWHAMNMNGHGNSRSYRILKGSNGCPFELQRKEVSPCSSFQGSEKKPSSSMPRPAPSPSDSMPSTATPSPSAS